MEIFNPNDMERNQEEMQMEQHILKKLKDKFGYDFLVRRIQNRYGMGDFENVLAICSMKDDENMYFSVVYNVINKQIVDDNFFVKCTSHELEKYILEELQNANKQAVVRIDIFGKRHLEKKYSVEELSELYKNNNFLSTIIIKDKISEHEIEKIFKNINKKYKNIFLKSLIYTISKEDFKEFYQKVCTLPEISETIIQEYTVNDMYIRKIYNNEVIKIK